MKDTESTNPSSTSRACFLAGRSPCTGATTYRVVGVDPKQDDYYRYVCDGHMAEIEKNDRPPLEIELEQWNRRYESFETYRSRQLSKLEDFLNSQTQQPAQRENIPTDQREPDLSRGSVRSSPKKRKEKP